MLPGADEPVMNDPAALGIVIERALEAGPDLSRITFAGEEIGLHQAIYADGGGAYLAQDGTVVERWDGMWERPELWLFDLHHYLFVGDTGKIVTGVLGFLLLGFSITGIILWWRTRKTFHFRLWPARFTRSAIVRHHRDLGVIASPLLIVAAFTGAMMVFPAVAAWLLSPLAGEKAESPLPDDLAVVDARTDWRRVTANAQASYPGAEARRIMLPGEPGAPIAIRYRQSFEWTPNGRSYVWVAPDTAEVVAVEDPATSDTASAITEKFYPIHAAKVGGLVWRTAMTFAGLALVLLGLLSSWSFWFVPKSRG